MPLSKERPFLIDPPVGTYLKHRHAYSVIGSFTRFPRPGRLMQVLRTVRPLGYTEDGEPIGWKNKVGLRNAGVETVVVGPNWKPHEICSIAMINGDKEEWGWLYNFLTAKTGTYLHKIAVNVSCPNTNHPVPALPEDTLIQKLCGSSYQDLIWKLPPLDSAIPAMMRLLCNGARYIQFSNTLASPIGGLSGMPLREANLPIVERAAKHLSGGHYTRSELIVGGGIYNVEHIRQYHDACGAERFALSTAFFRPFRGKRIINAYMEGRKHGAFDEWSPMADSTD